MAFHQQICNGFFVAQKFNIVISHAVFSHGVSVAQVGTRCVGWEAFTLISVGEIAFFITQKGFPNMNSKKQVVTQETQKVTFKLKPHEPQLELSPRQCLRLGRLLRRLSYDMVKLEEESAKDFIDLIEQLVTNYGMAKMAPGYMVKADPYFETVADYMGVNYETQS